MQIQVRPLLIVWLALCFFASAEAGLDRSALKSPAPALGLATQAPEQRPASQGPKTVNVRPRVAQPQSGVPQVQAKVDRQRVPLGEEVRFTLYPASVVRDPKYNVTLYFGDRKSQRTRKPEVVHLYTAPGTYTYSILVEANKDSTEPVQPVPGVKLLATPAAAAKGATITFSAHPDYSYPNLRYKFNFGDGSTTGWQDNPDAKHSYEKVGAFEAFVDISDAKNEVSKRSNRERIQVTPPAPPPISLSLAADRTSVPIKGRVSFTTKTSSRDPSLRYRFEFGDGSPPTPWQQNSSTTHTYSTAGKYSARAFVSAGGVRTNIQTAGSNSVAIEVKPNEPKPGDADLSVTPANVLPGFPVLLQATYAAADARTRYRFSFGDGSSSGWQSNPQQTHIYSLAGEYSAFVEVAISERGRAPATATSKPRKVTVAALPQNHPTPSVSPTAGPTPTSSPANSPSPSPSPSPGQSSSTPVASPSPSPSGSQSPTPPGGSTTPSPTPDQSPTPPVVPPTSPPGSWWLYLLIALLVLLIGYQVVKYFWAPRPSFHPNLDPGTSSVVPGKEPLAIDFQVQLKPNLSGGEYGLDTDEGSLIKSQSRDNH